MKKEIYGVTDGGARGGAEIESASRNPDLGGVVAIPGHDLMGRHVPEGVRFERVSIKLAAQNAVQIAEAFKAKGVTIAHVGQDDAAVGGTVDQLRKLGIPVMGASLGAARLEGDKPDARLFMRRHGIRCPDFEIFETPEQCPGS